MNSAAPFVRIGLRILGGYMIGRGWADEETTAMFIDPEVVGAVALMLSEGWYFLAKKFDWVK